MSEDFKRKLKDYTDGKLTGSEKEELELELEKMESYQAYLGELMGNEEDQRLHVGVSQTPYTPIKEASLLRRSKWKARLQTALTAIGIMVAVTIVSAILTGLFYGLGGRAQIYQDVVASAIALTRPNISVSGGTNSNAFFTMDYKGTLKKRIGSSEASVGDYSMNFLLGLPGIEQTLWRNESSGSSSSFLFQLPGSHPMNSDQEWATLDKLPAGTVAEAFISLDRLYTTDELLQQLSNKNMDPIWFAADTGQFKTSGDNDIVMNPTGFPYRIQWHAKDMTITSHSEEKRGWFGKVVMESSSSPSVQSYGSGDVRNQNFIDTLRLLQKYPAISKRIAPWLSVDPTIAYLESNDVLLYGVVVTGPTKELLKLKADPWVSSLRVGEVRLWNWHDRPL